jgi:hypothetical protein
MSSLQTEISVGMSLLFLALVRIRKVRNACEDGSEPMQDGVRVLATIADIQISQEWKEGERWERSLWDGRLTRQKTWQTYYDMTAEWTYPQTKQHYLFIVNLRHPERSAVDVQSFSQAKLSLSSKSMRAVGRQSQLPGGSRER